MSQALALSVGRPDHPAQQIGVGGLLHRHAPDAYPEDAGPVDVRETHMSWVSLTDRHDYKMKKPMRQERLDFSTLERRRHFCEEKVRLNRRLAPDVYLGTVPLAIRSDSVLTLGGPGDLIAFYKGCRALQRAKLAIWHLDEPDCRNRDHWCGRAQLAANSTARLL